jgi:hypothetical protein
MTCIFAAYSKLYSLSLALMHLFAHSRQVLRCLPRYWLTKARHLIRNRAQDFRLLFSQHQFIRSNDSFSK